jgi:hypothetical protein
MIGVFGEKAGRIIAGWGIRPYTLYQYKNHPLIRSGPAITSIASAQ